MQIIGEKLAFFADLYEDAKNKGGEIRDDLNKWLDQYKGDDKIDGSTERATAVRNITYELIESQISTEIPMPKCTASRYNELHNRNAISAERLLRQVRDKLPFEELNDLDERYTYIFGGSIWLVEWDDSLGDDQERGGVRVSVISPQDFFPQPNVWNKDDLEYAFFRYNTTIADAEARYGIKINADETELDNEIINDVDAGDGALTIVVCYYRGEDGGIGKYVFSGDTELEDVDRYYARRIRVCKACGKDEGECTCGADKWKTEVREEEVLTEDIVLSDGRIIPAVSPVISGDGFATHTESQMVTDAQGNPITDMVGGAIVPITQEVEAVTMEPTRIPYFTPNVFPFVIRKNISAYRSLLGQSDCEAIRPYQQAVNKLESRIMQKLMRSSVTPVMPEDAVVQVNNSIFGYVIKLRPNDRANQYGTVDTTPNIQMDIMEADRIYEQAKSAVGITNAFRGEADYAGQSGKAVQALMQQSAGRIESKRVMKRSAYAGLDEIIWQLYLAYADEPKVMQTVDMLGISHDTVFSRYDFLDMDELGRWDYHTDYTFSTDASSGVEQQRESVWEMNMNNFQNGTFGDPANPLTMLRYWTMQERAHYPNASDNVQYFRQIVAAMQNQQGGTM
jgi:hypothetical protein